jgi:hypothetical protein
VENVFRVAATRERNAEVEAGNLSQKQA